MNALYKLIRPSLLITLCAVSLNGFAQTRQVETISQTKTDRLELIEQPTPDTPVPLDPTPISSEPTAIANPNSQYSVGSIHGSFDVNGMGAATYMIPIEMPIGGGIEPHISIVYNSQSSNYGLLGYGFDVSGISVITRTGYNKFTDGVNKGVTYTSSDNYCLDGKRLILKSGTNGQEGSEYTVEGDPYTSVFIHGSYSNSYANTWFEVKTSDGSVYTYGKSDNSRLSYTNSKGYARIASWNIEEAQDKYSNCITYTYTKQDYKLYPTTITYGTNKLKSRGITNKVSFVYENISGNIRYFSIEDKLGKISKRIQSITSSTNSQTYRKYTFKYDDSSDKNWGKFSRLTSVTEENGQGDKYVPITISWNNLGTPSILRQSIGVVTDFSTTYEPVTSKSFLSADLTGDGVSDIVQLGYVEGKNGFRSGMYAYISTSKVDKTTGKVSFESSRLKRWYLDNFLNIGAFMNQCTGFSTCDIDGDGINDLLLQCYENSGDEVAYVVYYWIYGKDVIAGNTENIVRYKKNLKSTKSDSPITLAFDVNADGKDEICYVENSAYNGKYYGKIYSNIEVGKTVCESEFALTLNSKPEKIFKADYNNDGLSDIVILYKDGYKIYFNNGGNNLAALFTESNSLTGTNLKNYDHIQQGDFDGDGLMDFVLYPDQDRLSLYRNNGNGTFTEMSTITGTDINDKDTSKDDDKFSLIVEDFDGDGRSDVMVCKGEYDYHGFPKFNFSYDKTQIRWYYSTGTELKLAYSYNKDREDDALQKYIFTGDFDGDGMVEVANYGSPLNSTSTTFTENQINIYKLTTGAAGLGRVCSISDGMGSTTRINYEYTTHPSVYSKTAASSYPANVYSVPLCVVSSNTIENGSLGSQNVKYNYKDLKIHVGGRGILGFSGMTRNNTTLGEVQENTIAEMDQTYWLPKKIVSNYTIGGKTSSVETISNIAKVKNNYFAYEFRKEAKDFDGHKITTETYYDVETGVVTDQYVETSKTGMYKETVYDGFVQRDRAYLPTKVTLVQYHPDDEDNTYETTTEYVYDTKGDIVTEVMYSGTEMALTRTKTYDEYGNVKSSVDTGKGVKPVTVYNVYDNSGRFVARKSQTPAAAVNTYTYDIWGNVLSENDETETSNILTTTNTYDGWGKLLSVCLPDGSMKKYSYDWENNYSSRKQYYVLESEGCLLNGIFTTSKPWVKTWYDKSGNETVQQTVGPKNIEISKSTYYNVDGKVARIENKYGNLATTEYFCYDKLGRIVNDSLSTGKVISYNYESNGDGQHTVIINDNGRITKKTTDSWGNVCSVIDAIGGITEYYYSSNGKPKMICSGNATVEMAYDAAGNQISLTDPDAGTMTYEYAADGTIVKETDGRGIQTVNTFDNLGRIVSTKVRDFTISNDFTVSNEYGTSGTEKLRLVKQTTGTNSVEFVHDEYGRIIKETKYIQGQSPIVYSYEYNALNQMSKAIYPNNLKVEYEYDRYGYKTKVKADGKVVYNLDSYDGLSTKASFLGKLTSSTTRDKNGFESNVSILLGSLIIDSFDEEFDPATGNMLFRARNVNSTQLFEYDDMDRLVATKRKNKSGSVSEEMRMTYAKNGNITSKSDVGHYEYDDNTRPHAVVEINNDNEVLPTSTTSFVIHPIGKVQSITDDESGYNLSISYGPDFQRCYSTLTKNGSTIRTTIFGGAYEKTIESGVSREFYYLDGNVIVIRKDGKFTPYLALTDNLGSYLAVVDSLGNKVFVANYDAWGKQSISTTNEIRLRRGYCGHEMLTEFNLINMNGRLYSPFVGRFLSTDNYVQAPDNTQSFNRYSYCLNNPLKYTDPDGNWAGVDDIVAMVVGGLVNVGSNLLAGEVTDFWHGLSLFGIGAAAGEASLYGGTLAGAAVLGLGNSIVNQGFNNGWGNIDFGQVATDLTFSAATAYLGNTLGKYLSKPLSQLTKNITNSVLRETIKESLSNAASGFTIGALFSLNEKDADFESVFNNGLKGGAQGLAIGAISGVGSGIRLDKAQKQILKQQETIPVQGKVVVQQETTPEITQIEGDGTYSVYLGLDDNKVVRYVGITKRDPQIRFLEHLNSETERATLKYRVIRGTGHLTERQARIMEQTLINKYGMQKNDGALLNKINSISPKKWEKYGIK